MFSSQHMSNVNIIQHRRLHKIEQSKMHFHEPIEILYTTKGSLKCTFLNDEIIRKPGDILFINSNVPHSTCCLEEDSECTLIQFFNLEKFSGELSYISEFLHTSDTNYYLFSPEHPDHSSIVECINNMFRHKKADAPYARLQIISDIYAFLALFQKNNLISCDDNLVDQKLIRKIHPVFRFIDQNYASHLTLEDLANAVNFNKVYFCNLFRKATGGTAIDFLNFVRICKAEDLLKQNISVTEVSYLVGFSSPSYFNEIFKRYRFCSPSVYKQIHSNPDKMFYDRIMDEKSIFFDKPV